MRPTQKRQLIAGMAVVVAVLIADAGIEYVKARQMRQDSYWVAHTHEVLESMQSIPMTLKAAESGARGFVITGDRTYLGSYDTADATITGQLNRLAELTRDNATQGENLASLKNLVSDEFAELNKLITARRTKGVDAAKALVETDRARKVMDAIKLRISDMQTHERELLAVREETNRQAYQSTIFANILALAMGLTVVGAFLFLLQRHLSSLERFTAAIHEQREWLGTTLASIGDAVIATDSAGKINFVNPIAEKLLGWRQEEAKGQPLKEVFRIVNEETRREVENPAIRALSEGAIVGLANHTVLISKTGAEYPIDDSAAPIRNSVGEVTGVVLVFRDVADRRTAERALRASEARHAAIVRSSLDGIVSINDRGHIVDYNGAAEGIFGFSPQEAKEQGIDSLLCAGPQTALPQGLVEAAKNPEFINRRHEQLTRRKDGSSLLIEMAVIPQGEGRPGYTIFLRDITAQKQSQERIRGLLINEQNRSELLGRVAKASLTINSATSQQSVLDVVKAEARQIMQAQNADILFEPVPPHPIPDSLVAPLVGRNGQPFAQLIVSGKEEGRFDADDRAVLMQLSHMAAVAFDNARLYEELVKSDRHKNEFLATLAHELRNPLAPIRNSLQIMQLAGDDREVIKRSEEMINRQLQQMVRLIDDLLDLSRISRGKIELRKERVDLKDALQNAIETSRPLIDASRHQLVLSIPSQPIPLDADLTRLAQVFLNLLNNAAKYTDPGGRIELRVEPQGDKVAVHVRDTGIGIPPTMLPSIFDMFTQVDRSLGRAQGGLGIGLTLVARLTEMHGGTVEAASEGLGKGSEFTVRLPLAGTAASAPAERHDAQPAAAPVNGKRIVVVDDNHDAADSLSQMLRIKGHQVETAYDGIEAVATVERFQPSVVLLDIGLPGINGLEAARRIRAHQNADSLLLIALTGWGQDEDRRQSEEAGFDYHLVKPVDPAELDRIFEAFHRQSS